MSLALLDVKIIRDGKAMLMAAGASKKAATKELDEFFKTLVNTPRGAGEVIPLSEEVSEGDFKVEGEVLSDDGSELEWEDYSE
ncbi:hypothetical protein FQN50_006993 [Emmonsiellopsis sp. PD_5]|nr:hypothetical protein FQN50_006993 [Emmonsiellopsis sp. PD_5]